MILDNPARDGNGRWFYPANGNGDGQETELARLTARQLGHGPGAPGTWSRFLVAHARWILAVTLAVMALAAIFASAQTQLYRSEAAVVVSPASAAASSGGQQPDMSTEEGVATSGIVLSKASKATGVPVATLSDGASVSARGASYVLLIMYSDPDPHIAQQRAQAIAEAYTSFRSARPRSAPSTAPTATLITPASLPASPYSPDYGLDLGIALLVGLTLGIATAWGRDHLDDRLRGPLDLERQASAGVLGLIPAFRPGEPGPAGRLAVVASPASIVAEAYRSLRTRVLRTATTTKAQTILVTNPAWEDKGTVAANLAAAIAQSGRRTVLVCADLRWGRAHRLFGTWDGAQGLAELLQQKADLAAALHPTKIARLCVVPPGARQPDPAAVLQLPALGPALNEIRALCDVVVIEAPPVLVSPDAQPLAESAEMTVLVADARVSTRAQVRAAALELERERAEVAGWVLVNVGRERRLGSDLHRTAEESR